MTSQKKVVFYLLLLLFLVLGRESAALSIHYPKVHFETNSAKIRKPSQSILDDWALALLSAQSPWTKVQVQGHADATEKNPGPLSQSRAEAVQKYLIKKGIAATRLEAMSYGTSRPVATNETKQGRAENRRVEFQVFY